MLGTAPLPSVTVIAAVTFDAVRNGLLIAAVVAIAIGVVAALIIKWVVGRLLVVALFAALAVVLWTQRTNLGDCADRVHVQITEGKPAGSCTVLGVTVDLP